MEEEEEDCFPKKVLLQFVGEKLSREEAAGEIALWAKGQREKELEDRHLWQEVMEELYIIYIYIIYSIQYIIARIQHPGVLLKPPPLFHHAFYRCIPSYYKIKSFILILRFQNFNESLKANNPRSK